MAYRVLVSDTNFTHAKAVKNLLVTTYNAWSANFGLQESLVLSANEVKIELRSILTISYILKETDIIMAIRPTDGILNHIEIAEQIYPRTLLVMPMGSNTHSDMAIFTDEEPPLVVTVGAGDTEGQNNTGYGNGIEFWDDEFDTSGAPDLSSYASAVIGAKLLFMYDWQNLIDGSSTWWNIRYKARMGAWRTESSRTTNLWDIKNGYGQILPYIGIKGLIPLDPYLVGENTETEIIQAFADVVTLTDTVAEKELEIAELEASDAIMSPYFDDDNIRTGFEDTGNAETEDVVSSRISSFSFEDGIVNCKLKLYTDADTFAKDNTAYIAKIDGNEGLITLNNFLYNWVKNNTSRLTSLTFKTQTK